MSYFLLGRDFPVDDDHIHVVDVGELLRDPPDLLPLFDTNLLSLCKCHLCSLKAHP